MVTKWGVNGVVVWPRAQNRKIKSSSFAGALLIPHTCWQIVIGIEWFTIAIYTHTVCVPTNRKPTLVPAIILLGAGVS